MCTLLYIMFLKLELFRIETYLEDVPKDVAMACPILRSKEYGFFLTSRKYKRRRTTNPWISITVAKHSAVHIHYLAYY